MAIINGDETNENIVGTGLADDITGGAGDDTITGGDGNDVIDGGTGDGESIPSGMSDDDEIFGGAGDDTITGNEGNDTIDGGADDDSIAGGVGNDSIAGGTGTDTIDGGVGADIVEGGAGDDIITLGDDTDEDVIVFGNGDGNDVVSGFDGPVSDGAGGFTSEDKIDVSGYTDAGGAPVNAWDVVVTQDGNGDAVLTFPDGDSITLVGVAPEDVDSAPELTAMGIPCFVRGTMIQTDQGERRIQDLQIGDLVQTLDHGLQPIRWIGSKIVSGTGHLAPICFKAGALGNAADLCVSPQHRMLVQGWKAEMHFGEDEVLAPAKALINDHNIRRQPCNFVEYHHILFDQHEILTANGTLSESFHPNKIGFGALADESRQEILTIFPELATADFQTYGPPARAPLRVSEAIVLADRAA